MKGGPFMLPVSEEIEVTGRLKKYTIIVKERCKICSTIYMSILKYGRYNECKRMYKWYHRRERLKSCR